MSRSHRRALRLLLRALCLVTAAWTTSALALGPSWQLPAGSVDAIGADRMWLFGRAASLRTFEAPGDIADVAIGLLAQVSTSTRLQPMPDGMLIAGVDGHVHWLVRLMGTSATRTQGSLSAIDLRSTPSLLPPPWQPVGLAVRLDVAAGDGDMRVRQLVLTDTGAADGTYRRVCSALHQHGWRPDEAGARASCRVAPLAWPASSFWKRDGATLALVIDRQPTGASVFALQTDPIAPQVPSTPWRALVQRWQSSTGNQR